MKNSTTIIRKAGQFSCKAHKAWHESVRSQSDEACIGALRRGDKAWSDALYQLRLFGIKGLKMSARDRKAMLTDPCFAR